MNTTFSLNPASSICSVAPLNSRFDIDACINRTRGCDFFPLIPYHLIEVYCGSGYGAYRFADVFGALTSWVIPLFGLLANMHFAESTLTGLDCPWTSRITSMPWIKPWWNILKSQLPKLFLCSVQLANPIGTIWSLADKLELGQRLWDHVNARRQPGLDVKACRDVTHVCYCLEEFGYDLFEKRVNRLLQLWEDERRRRKSRILLKHLRKANRDLAFARVRNLRHTTFAALLYIIPAVAALWSSRGSTSLDFSLPHTVALRELCFFLLAQVLLSSAIGAWSQQWAPQQVMRPFAQRIYKIEVKLLHGQPELWKDLATKEISLWDGGSYAFRPQKSRKSHGRSDVSWFTSRPLRSRNLIVSCGMACLTVLLSFLFSFLISFFTPTEGIGGRSLAEIIYISVWIANFVIDLYMTRSGQCRKRLFVLIWLKDSIISLLVVLFFFLPFIGWYNSAKSWSAWFSLFNKAYLDLDIANRESSLAFRLYIPCLITGAIMPLLLACFVVWMNWNGITLSYRSNDENMRSLQSPTGK